MIENSLDSLVLLNENLCIMMRTLFLSILLPFGIVAFGQSISNPSLLCERGWRHCTAPDGWTTEGVTGRAFSYYDGLGSLFQESTTEDVIFSFFSNGIGQWGGFSQNIKGLESNREYCISFEAAVNRGFDSPTTIDFELYYDGRLYDSETFVFPTDTSRIVDLCFISPTNIGTKKLLLRTNNLVGLTTFVLIKAGSGSFYENQTTSTNYHQFSNDIKISPNPTQGILSLQLEESSTEYKIAVYSISGTKHFEKFQYGSDNIDLSFLEEGLYYVEIINENKRMIKKIMITN